MRVANWDVKLVGFAIGIRGEDFDWGISDCVSLARQCLYVILDEDPWDSLGTWKTKTSALKAFKGIKIDKYLEKTGAIEIDYNFLTTGDFVISPNEDIHGLMQIAIVLPMHKVLVSSMSDGVTISDYDSFAEGSKYWRYV